MHCHVCKIYILDLKTCLQILLRSIILYKILFNRYLHFFFFFMNILYIHSVMSLSFQVIGRRRWINVWTLVGISFQTNILQLWCDTSANWSRGERKTLVRNRVPSSYIIMMTRKNGVSAGHAICNAHNILYISTTCLITAYPAHKPIKISSSVRTCAIVWVEYVNVRYSIIPVSAVQRLLVLYIHQNLIRAFFFYLFFFPSLLNNNNNNTRPYR